MLSEKFMPSTTTLFSNCKPAALVQENLKDENYLLHFENDNKTANPTKSLSTSTNKQAVEATNNITIATTTASNTQTITITTATSTAATGTTKYLSMTKQLTTIASAGTITTANTAPTAISPTATSTVTTTTTTSTSTTSATIVTQCLKQQPQSLKTTLTMNTTGIMQATEATNDNSANRKINLTTTTQALVVPVAAAVTTNATTFSNIQPDKKPPAAAKQTTTSRNDSNGGRSAALERAYVHDVYEHCEEPTGPIRPRVAQFLSSLDPGSVVCDVGCGSGRYLTGCNPQICTIGVDRCWRLSKDAREMGGEVALCDNLDLPFRDESFDAVLSLAVVHHFATTERRVNALRELARILRIGGRVVITVWALEQRNRRFESQDVLIPWQPPKTRNFNCSDEEDEDDFLPPYHAYTEDSTNSSRSTGDGDSSSLSSSSPGESCYSFVRRAIQKITGGSKHAWFLDSWTSKDTKNDSSLDYEDARDLPIELRRLEDFEDFTDPPLSAGLKSRSLGSILNPPPRQIVRSRSSVPSLGVPLLHTEKLQQNLQLFLNADTQSSSTAAMGHSPTHYPTSAGPTTSASGTSSHSRRPKLIKQKQSLCDEDYQLPENPFHMISSYNTSSNSVTNSLYTKSSHYPSAGGQYQAQQHHQQFTARQMAQTGVLLRKQSSLNEELMAANRIREKDRVRKRLQKQMSLNEAFLCRSAMFSKRLQIIREGVASKIKSSTGSLERVTKNGLTKIVQNIKAAQATAYTPGTNLRSAYSQAQPSQQAHGHGTQHNRCQQHQHYHHHHHHHHYQQQHQTSSGGLSFPFPTHILHKQTSLGNAAGKFAGPVTYCSGSDCGSTACFCSTYHHGCSNCSSNRSSVSSHEDNNPDDKVRRHSRESGSDSSKDSSLQSDTSIESEDSFASVIFIPKPEQHQQQLNYQQQHQNSNSSSSNSSSSNGGNPLNCPECSNCCSPTPNAALTQLSNSCVVSTTGMMQQQQPQHQRHHHQHRVPSQPTSPLIMPCPPTPAHSPAAAQAQVTSPPQSVSAVTAAMAILTPPPKLNNLTENSDRVAENSKATAMNGVIPKSHFTFDDVLLKQQQQTQKVEVHGVNEKVTKPSTNFAALIAPKQPKTEANKITRQTIKDLPPIPKFRKQQSLQIQRQTFPFVRRSSATSGASVPSIQKLFSLELYNPATDDLDSDSSEPSSPDSIDSVISAPRSAVITASASEDHTKDKDSLDIPGDENEEDLEIECNIKFKQQQYHNGDLKINPAAPNDIIFNDDSASILPKSLNTNPFISKQEDCAEFAEKLSAQLLCEIGDKNNRPDCCSLEGIGDIGDYLDDLSGSIGSSSGGSKKQNGGSKDLVALRDELRERRLMLVHLSTQPSLQQSPASSSTSSLSSQTRSFTIPEEDEDEDEEENERSYTLQLYENCKISKFNYKRNRQYNLNPETAYLLQDDGDSSIRDDDDDDDFENDVIIEEDEEEETEANGGDQFGESMTCRQTHNTIKSSSLEENSMPTCAPCSEQKSSGLTHDHKNQSVIQNRHSTESWEHSHSSTTSLDSPSQGGATTHHRYYHVFREGELDALINHHVASLHIVSSYYERASWCVIAEKVHVWTI